MKKTIFLMTALLSFNPLTSAQAQTINSWQFYCQTDEMTDKKLCGVSNLVKQGDNMLNLVIPAGETKENDIMFVSTGGYCTGGMIRVDSNTAEELYAKGGDCVFMWEFDGPFAKQLVTGSILKIRIENYRNETDTFEISLKGMKESYQKMMEFRDPKVPQ